MTTPFSGTFVARRLGLVMINMFVLQHKHDTIDRKCCAGLSVIAELLVVIYTIHLCNKE